MDVPPEPVRAVVEQRLKHMKKLFAYIFILLPLTLAWGQSADKAYAEMLEGMYAHSVPLITPEKLSHEMGKDKVYILDARSPAEYNQSHLKGARFINYDTFNKKKVEDIPKEAKVVVYCSVGWRSERIGENLQKLGYNNVFNLYGGIFEWYNEGYPVYNAQGKTETVHPYNADWGKWVKER